VIEYAYGDGKIHATPQAAFNACQEANETGSETAMIFTGAGLNDLAHGAGSEPDPGVPEREVRVEIDATGTPDTFKWSKDGGSTWEATGVAITGAGQALADGITIDFGATTGHTLGDRWDWTTEYESAAFSEVNSIRGYGAAVFNGYDTDEPVLRLAHSITGRGVLPTVVSRLVIDRNGLDAVEFADDQDAGCIVGGAADGTALASHVTIDLPGLHSTQAANGRAIIVCPDRTGGQTAYDWIIKCPAIYSTRHALVLGCLNSARLEVQIKGSNYQLGANGEVAFTGSGLDDLTAGGTPGNGMPPRNYKVEIDGANDPDPDTFKWSDDGGTTWEAEEVEITGAEQELQEGVTVAFAATTGHTAGEFWTWSTIYSGAAIYADGAAGIYGAFTGGLAMLNCTARAEGPVLDLAGDFILVPIHCSFHSQMDDVLRLTSVNGRLALVLLNTILQTLGEDKRCLRSSSALLCLLHSNGNCYHYPGDASALAEIAGTEFADLAAWKAAYGLDGNSLDADPLLVDPANGEFTLAPASPCRMRGRAAANAGLEGIERAISIDIGAYQPSLPANWSIKNEGGEITARIEGRIKTNL
jgi:hypothetical protein